MKPRNGGAVNIVVSRAEKHREAWYWASLSEPERVRYYWTLRSQLWWQTDRPDRRWTFEDDQPEPDDG